MATSSLVGSAGTVGGRWAAGIFVLGAVLGACAPADPPADPQGAGTGRPSVPVATGTVPPASAGERPDPASGPGRPRRPGGVAVVRVVDGDTIEVRLRSGRVESVRLIGINAPEQGECLADRASRRLAVLEAGRRVRLERDVSDRDDYGRLLRYVLVGARDAGRVLVAEGLALSRAYPPDTSRQGELDAAQARAQAAGRGQWAPDACGPEATARIVVGAARTDPPGDESLTPNEEWVEVVNRSGRPVDLTGWGVRDESASNRFSFPAGFRLGAGATVRIHSGCGPATAGDLHWCVSGSAVWNNDGDTVFVTDPRGNVVAQRSV